MNYNRIKQYFQQSTKYIPPIWLVAIGAVVFIFPGIVIWIIRVRNIEYNSHFPTDLELEEACLEVYRANQMDLKIEHDNMELDDLHTLTLSFFSSSGPNLLTKVGKDGKFRSSSYSLYVLSVQAGFLTLLCHEFSLIDETVSKSCQQYHYQNIDYTSYKTSGKVGKLTFRLILESKLTEDFSFEFPSNLIEAVRTFLYTINDVKTRSKLGFSSSSNAKEPLSDLFTSSKTSTNSVERQIKQDLDPKTTTFDVETTFFGVEKEDKDKLDQETLDFYADTKNS
jgi:hypothetical protein